MFDMLNRFIVIATGFFLWSRKHIVLSSKTIFAYAHTSFNDTINTEFIIIAFVLEINKFGASRFSRFIIAPIVVIAAL